MKIFYIDANNNTPQINYPLIEGLYGYGYEILYCTSLNRWSADYYKGHYNIREKYIFFNVANKISNQRLRQLCKIITYPVNLLHLSFLILKEQPDIIHFINISIPFIDLLYFSLIRLLNKKFALTQHNFIRHDNRRISHTRINIYKKVDNIVCLSVFTKNQFPEKLKSKITIIKHGNTYEKELAKHKIQKTSFSIGDKFIVLFVGLIRPYKGIENLINSYQYLESKIKEKVEYRIIGNVLNKRYFNYLNSLISNNNKIILQDKFLEYSEMINQIRKSDVGALPYLSASQSGLPYLYSSLKTPILITNVGGLREQVDTRFAEVCSPDAAGIGNAINRIFNRLETNKISEESFLQFNEENTFENICKEYSKFYSKLLK